MTGTQPPSSAPDPEAIDPRALRDRLDAVMLRDRQRLRRRLDGTRRLRGDEMQLALQTIVDAVVEAEARVARRAATVPTITLPAELPITERRDEILALIEANQVVIVAGETGSGKSTQLPKLCLELGRGVRGHIGHTQPRRLAARSVAERVAEELGGRVGGTVGFAVRFSDTVGEDTLVKVMTDGILLAETRRDRDLLAYDTLVIDEAHERSLNIDFLLGYLKQLLPRRPDLKVIITSATIDTEKFSQHFDGAPVVEVSGRTYPVEVRYRPFGQEPDQPRDQVDAIGDAVDELWSHGPGDILVFLSGEREIHDTADSLRRSHPDAEVLPLYARLGAAEQRRIFSASKGRRVVLSTNVAETSITVPGVRYVIDTGAARISRYNRRLKVQRLPIEPVSQASANQRAGRCGRVAPGICIRLYAEDDFTRRAAFTEAEILRTNLASVVLQAASLDLGDLASFPFVDPPDTRAIRDGVALLEELGAFDPTISDPLRRLTPLGRRLARLPVDPRLARMVLASEDLACSREVMIIAAALSIQDPRERPSDKQAQADQLHARFRVEGSDFLGFVRLWDHVREIQRTSTKNELRRRCKEEMLHFLRIREWQDLDRQLRDVAGELGIHANREPAPEESVHKALLTGLLSQVGVRSATSEREFQGPRNARFVIANGSVLARKPPRWVMAGELVETNRLWARVTARIQPEWLERAGAHLCKHTFGDPRWDERRGAAVATERVTLYGLPVVTARTVDWARIDPADARRLFVHHALVGREWGASHAFLDHNAATRAAIRALEDRARRRDLLITDEAFEALYEARIPAEVVSTRHFDRWWRAERERNPGLLTFSTDELLDPDAEGIRPEDFPDAWEQAGRSFALSYRYEPGRPDDGVTVHVPLPLVNTLRDDGFDWQVPGRRAELVGALIRTLPKTIRRHLVPLDAHVAPFLAEHGPADGPIAEVLAAHLTRTIRSSSDGWVDLTVRPEDLDAERLPDDLRVTFSIDDAAGVAVATGKQLGALAARVAGRVHDALTDALPAIERTGIVTWDLGTVPQRVEGRHGDHRVVGFPALVDERTSVALRVLTDERAQRRAMRAGVLRLLRLTVDVPRKSIDRAFDNAARLALHRTGLGAVDSLVDDCIAAAFDVAYEQAGGPVWDESSFEALREHMRREVPDVALRIAGDAARIVTACGEVAAALAKVRVPAFAPSVDDVTQQIRWLVHTGFVRSTGAARLPDVLRYVQAMVIRLGSLAGEAERDRRRMAPVRLLQDEIDEVLLDAPADRRAELLDLRWQVEELRVSVFAQSLGTAGPVSESRIRRELDRIAPPV